MCQPTDQDLRRARDEFRSLLDLRTTREAQWQRFFAENPYVLSMSLPLRLSPSEIIPLGRPSRSEPDFIFFTKNPNPNTDLGFDRVKASRFASHFRNAFYVCFPECGLCTLKRTCRMPS